ncbi:MAG: hypothetical protein LBM66_04640 [Bifidobacteriaceae bacterium]|jgi:hypothetical protein|nr:hypothetical protein [Bifidobacteriaceae bacterium]
MKRSQVIDRLKRQARAAGLPFERTELTRHTAIKIGTSAHTISRHHEVDETTAHKFWDQFCDVFEKGWWR